LGRGEWRGREFELLTADDRAVEDFEFRDEEEEEDDCCCCCCEEGVWLFSCLTLGVERDELSEWGERELLFSS
jgi:hypothetical protein